MDDIYYVYVLTSAILIKSDSHTLYVIIINSAYYIYLNSYRRINYLKKYTYRKFQVFFLHWGD